jgi:hypothetical protein
MRNRFSILFVLAATLFACNSDSMINEDINKAEVEAPIKIKRVEGTFLLGGNATCNTLYAEGEGIVSRLGLSALVEQWCWNGDPEDVGTRSIVFTAANGDELWGFHNSVVWTSPNESFVETLTFAGGTGRFENASGEFTEYVEIEFTGQFSGTFVLSGEGTLKY